MIIQTLIVLLLLLLSGNAYGDMSYEEKSQITDYIEEELEAQGVGNCIVFLDRHYDYEKEGYDYGTYDIAVLRISGGKLDSVRIAQFIGQYTAQTNWKTHALYIWHNEYKQGIGILTEDCRYAVRQGSKADSIIKCRFFRITPRRKRNYLWLWIVVIIIVIIGLIILFIKYPKVGAALLGGAVAGYIAYKGTRKILRGDDKK